MPGAPGRWRTPEEILDIGVERARVVLINEAHNGMRRCVRTRRIGLRMIDHAHRAGLRHLAMEALQPGDAMVANRERRLPDRPGYLGQPEMRELINRALTRGWALIAYEADMTRKPAGYPPLSQRETNWRDAEQAANLAAALATLPAEAGLLVWCGNHHLAKRPTDWWRPMGSRVVERGISTFAIDQNLTVRFDEHQDRIATAWVDAFAATLDTMGGTAGFLADEAPEDWVDPCTADAYLLSTDNNMD